MQFCGMFHRLKEKWKVSWPRFILIFTTFALGGSLCGYLGRKLLLLLQIDATAVRIPVYIVLVTLLWPFCVLLISIPLGQFNFFRRYLAKMGSRMTGRRSTLDSKRKNIAIFASGAGSNAKKIIEHFRNHPTIQVALIVCNNPKAGVLQIAADNHLPVMLINKKSFYESEVCLDELKIHKIDLLVLAGFLWKIPGYLISHYSKNIINIHPALLPKYGGKGMYGEHVHSAVVAAKEKQSGITIHYVDEHYDNGDIIFQATCEILPTDTPASLAEKVHQLEHQHFARVIEKLLTGIKAF